MVRTCTERQFGTMARHVLQTDTCELADKQNFGGFLNYANPTLGCLTCALSIPKIVLDCMPNHTSTPTRFRFCVDQFTGLLALGSWSSSNTIHIHEATNCELRLCWPRRCLRTSYLGLPMEPKLALLPKPKYSSQ